MKLVNDRVGVAAKEITAEFNRVNCQYAECVAAKRNLMLALLAHWDGRSHTLDETFLAQKAGFVVTGKEPQDEEIQDKSAKHSEWSAAMDDIDEDSPDWFPKLT